jgi:site-specific recombinase XerD
MSELRQKMIDLMVYRNYARATISAYVGHVARLAKHYNRCPSVISFAEVQAYLVHLIRNVGYAWSTVNVAAMSVQFVYREVLGRSEAEFKLPPRKYERRLPVVLSLEETRRLLDAPDRLRDRAILHTIYGGGLRVGELTRLKPTDIESDPMRIRVVQGKGRKDRYTILPRSTLALLRDYYRAERPANWLFNGRSHGKPISERMVEIIYHRAKDKAGIERGGGVHILRHCFASHHLIIGTDLKCIQEMMGHKHLATTERYLHVTPDRWESLRSPADG